MKNLLVFLFSASLLVASPATASPAARPAAQSMTRATVAPPTYQEAYDYAVHTLGVDPLTVGYVLAGYPIVTGQQQYVHDRLAELGYEFPAQPGS